jgi:transcriptional regulator with XRE-family HTH domain
MGDSRMMETMAKERAPKRTAKAKVRASSSLTFSERLVIARELRNLSRLELCERTSLSPSLLCRLEGFTRGSTEAETVFRLANALDVRPEWLWHGVEPMEHGSPERRLRELRRKLAEPVSEDANLARALRKEARADDAVTVAVARALAERGERHTVDGWLARLGEIREQLEPLLPR